MKKILLFLFIFLPFIVSAQFRMVGTATWSTLNDSTYQASISFQSDLTGMGYLATQIVDTFRLFTPTEKIYRVDSVWNKTFSSADVRIVEMLGTQGIPVGQVMVFNPAGRNTIPNIPFGSTGGTAQLNAAVDAWNARQIADDTDNQDATEVPLAPAIDFGGNNTTDVQEALEVIKLMLDTTANSVDLGNILFVSKNGDNATGQKGDFFKPFLTIQRAIDSASAGDLIVVYPGVYNEGTNLAQKGVSYFYFGKAQCTGCFLSGAENVVIRGAGIFRYAGTFTQISGGKTYDIEADSIYCNNLINQTYNNAGNVYVNCTAFRHDNGAMISSGIADTSTFYTYSVTGSRAYTNGGFTYEVPKRNVFIRFNTVYWVNNQFISGWQTNMNNANVIQDFDVVYDNNSNKIPFFFWEIPSGRNWDNAHLEIRIKKYVGNDYLLNYSINSSAGSVENMYVRFNCEDCVYTDTLSFIFEKASTSSSTTLFPVYVDGNYTTAAGAFLDRTNASNTFSTWLILRGNFTTKSTWKPPFRLHTLAASKLYFDGSTITTGSTSVAPLSANTAGANVYLKNTYTNSTTKNANINYNYRDFTGRTHQYEVASTSTLSFYSPNTLIFGDNTSGAVSTTIPACSAALAGWKFSAVREDSSANTWTLLTAAANDFWFDGKAQATLTLAGKREAQCECGLNGATYYWMCTTQSTVGGNNGIFSSANNNAAIAIETATYADDLVLTGGGGGTGTGFTRFAADPDESYLFTMVNKGAMFIDTSRGYFGLDDDQRTGKFQFTRSDSSLTLKGKYLKLEGHSGGFVLPIRMYDLDKSHYYAYRPNNTITTSYTEISPAAGPGSNDMIKLHDTDGTTTFSTVAAAAGTTNNADGVWTPTLTASASSPVDTILATYKGRYSRTDSVVTYDVTFDYAFGTNTGAGTFGVGISLPIASNFTSTHEDAGGTMTYQSISGSSPPKAVQAFIAASADTSNDRLSAGGFMYENVVIANVLQDSANAWTYPHNRFRFHVTGSYIVK